MARPNDICKLCNKQADLCESHIIAKQFYKPLFGNDHKLRLLSTSQLVRTRIYQDGLKEYLLCEACEQYIKTYEDYAKNELYCGLQRVISENSKKFIELHVDYPKFKLFLLSILWRASVSSDPGFDSVSLGKHEAIIKQMLLAGNPGKFYQYSCLMSVPLLNKKIIMDDIIILPDKIKLGRHTCYRFFFSGCLWAFVVSSHLKSMQLNELMLKEDGSLLILLRDAERCELLTQFFQKLNRQNILTFI